MADSSLEDLPLVVTPLDDDKLYTVQSNSDKAVTLDVIKNYILDNVEETPIGNIINPLLDLPLTNGLGMIQGKGATTFSRSSSATLVDRYGVLKTYDIDEPRFNEKGILIEESSTNICLHSEELDNTSWAKISSEVIIEGTAPDGVSDAWKVYTTETETGKERYCRALAESTFSEDDIYSLSVFMKKGNRSEVRVASYYLGNSTSGVSTIVNFDTETATNGFKLEKLTDGWYRITLQNVCLDSANTSVQLRLYINDNDRDDLDGYTYYWGGQIEKKPNATSYIQTEGAATTRAGELCKIEWYDNLNNFLSSTILVTISKFSPTVRFLYMNSVFDITITDTQITSNFGLSVFGDFTGNYKLGLVFDGANGYVYKDGVLIGNSSISVDNIVFSGDLYLGDNDSSAAYKNLRFYDIVLSSDEISLLGE